jgi:hypothetical protein
MVGDSLTDQHFHALGCMLGGESIVFSQSGAAEVDKLNQQAIAYYKKNMTSMKATNWRGIKDNFNWGVPQSVFKSFKLPNGGLIRYQRVDHAFMEYAELARFPGGDGVKDALRRGLLALFQQKNDAPLSEKYLFLFNTGNDFPLLLTSASSRCAHLADVFSTQVHTGLTITTSATGRVVEQKSGTSISTQCRI